MAGFKVDKDDLKEIKITLNSETKANMDLNPTSSEESTQEIKRDIIKVEDIIVKRKNDEGRRPLFDRKDIKVNKIKTKIDYESFNLLTHSPCSQTTREISKVTEEELYETTKKSYRDIRSRTKSPIKHISRKFEDSKDSKMELVQNYLDELVKMNDISPESETRGNCSKKRFRSSSSSSFISNDSSFERYKERSRGHKKKNKHFHRKRSRMDQTSHGTVQKYSKRSSSESRSSGNISLSTISSNETLREYKEFLEKRSYDDIKDYRKSLKRRCDSRDRKSQMTNKCDRPSLSYSSKRDTRSYSKYDKKSPDTYEEQRICSKKRCDCRECKSQVSRYHKNERHTSSYSSYSKDYYTDVPADEDDVELKYHRYNAAMYAVSVILEIIKQHQ